MANIKSQIKRNRQNDKKRLQNRVYRNEARIAVRTARTTIDEGVAESKEDVKKAISALDKAAERGVIHKNNAARRKSRLVKALAKMEPAKVEVAPVFAGPVIETEPVKKKAAPRKSTAAKKVEEPKAVASAEPKADLKKKASTTTKKPAPKKAAKKATVKKAVTPKKTTVK